MFFSKPVTAVLSGLALAGFGSAGPANQIHQVDVGSNGEFNFKPNITTAAVGDVIDFHFFARNHSVVQSRFDNPCVSTEGFFSGFVPVASGEGAQTFRVTVNDTKPIWFYCSQPGGGGHCARGMVGCVNCATTQNTLAAFAAGAAMTNNRTVTQPAMINGGVFMANSNAGNGSTPTGTGGSPTGSTTGSTTSPSPTGAAVALSADKLSLFALGAGLSALTFLL